ncbi:MAG: protein-L-isoaspartate(D-aspartate) O-methyltransferase [Planctomycetota bacterium]|nr:MAG: protein-L-isoaspartate(D-aspartate) O-methyltransferase [Planctomycetota bacterium]
MSAPNDLTAAKRRMLDQHLRARGITDERVLAAMARVPREEFVPEPLRARAYDDCALPVEMGQTISQPYTVAFMAQAAGLQGNERVLEIGTGTGYGAAVLGQLAAEVFSIERWPDLHESATQRLQRLGIHNVRTKLGDGSLGWSEQAPFDAIVVTAAAEQLPDAYFQQLGEGGRIIIPIGELSGGQTMSRFTRQNGKLREESLGLFSFVPLVCDS